MTRPRRLVDFQITVGPSTLQEGERRSANLSLFSTYEPVRLWLKERDVRAPFEKILIGLCAETTFAAISGSVVDGAGVCEVILALDPGAIAAGVINQRWAFGIAEQALIKIQLETGWQSEELVRLLQSRAEQTPPLVHFFDKLRKKDRTSGVECSLWFATQPGRTSVGARVGEVDVTLLSEPGPIFLEDSFPVSRAAIRDGEYRLSDSGGNLLASIPIRKIIETSKA
jgi:hypothetical protein